MTTKKAILTLLPILVFAFLLTANTAQSAEDSMKSPLEATAQFYTALNAMFNGEPEPMKAVWSHSEDVSYMGPGGEYQIGWNDVVKSWDAQAAMKMGGKIESLDMHSFTGQDLAITQNYEQGENKDQDGKVVTVKIRATNIFRKENGEWKMENGKWSHTILICCHF